MCRCEAVWCTWIVNFLSPSNESGRLYRRVLDWNDLVVLTMQDEGRDIDLLGVLGEIGLREGLSNMTYCLLNCVYIWFTPIQGECLIIAASMRSYTASNEEAVNNSAI